MRPTADAVPESLRTRLQRWGYNLHPTYRSTGAWITYVAGDWREVRLRLPLAWRTRNVVGTIFGGSMYAAVDPIYMIMLIENLGPGYVVWDKAASIRFRRPARRALHARFRLGGEELAAIRAATAGGEPVDRTYTVELATADGEVCAVVGKTIYVRER